MEDVRRNWLMIARVQIAFDRRFGLHCELCATFQHSQDGPCTGCDSMPSAQTGRQGRLVERASGSNDDEADRELRLVAQWTVEN